MSDPNNRSDQKAGFGLWLWVPAVLLLYVLSIGPAAGMLAFLEMSGRGTIASQVVPTATLFYAPLLWIEQEKTPVLYPMLDGYVAAWAYCAEWLHRVFT